MVTEPLILPAGEFSAARQVYDWLRDSGHLDHGEFPQDLADNSGTVTCACGSQFAPGWLSTCCGKPVSVAGRTTCYWVCDGCGKPCDARPAGGCGMTLADSTVELPDLVPCDGGFKVKETATHSVVVIRMIYNWRLATVPKSCPMSYDRGWCYAGTGPASLARAVLAAAVWDGSDDTEPEGWNKNIQTGEWREPGQAVAP
jgi:hypothetical protein